MHSHTNEIPGRTARSGPRIGTLLVTCLLTLGGVRGGSCQILTGELRGLGGDEPIVGGLVAPLDPDGRTIVTAISDRLGRFVLRPDRSGRYSVYAEGLGYFSSVDGPVDLSPDDSLSVWVHLERNPVALEAYSGISQVPERWRDSLAACGIVLIWSRGGHLDRDG